MADLLADERLRQMTQLAQIVTALLQDGRHDEAYVREQLQLYRPVAGPGLSDEDVEHVARQLAERLNIDVDRGTVITGGDHEPWLADRRREMDWGRWLAYKQLLLRRGRPPKVVEQLDELSDEILDLVGDPQKPGTWGRRGLVLGDVQSGKTGTYVGLFNKAADAGYRLVILLAGNTEVLRQQTQARVDEGFIGRDSTRQLAKKGTDASPRRLIGVGELRKDLAHAIGMTTVLRDFRKASFEATNITIQADANHPYVFVLKKNKSILKQVILWLEEQAATYGGAIPIPVLILDDESDYASINTKEESDPTAINKAIRDILALFERSAYVAFTATPFANIFIDHGVENDLFPRNFVYSLESPTNYVGSVSTFGTSDEVRTDGLHELDDVEEHLPIRHSSKTNVDGLPDSLRVAIQTFFLANALRDLRGNQDHARAMLVNVSRFKSVQAQVHSLVEAEVIAIRNAIQLHGAVPGSTHTELESLASLYKTEFPFEAHTWDDVSAALPGAIADIRVHLFNSDRDKKLMDAEEGWDRPPRMIAVGGDVLSRGLTLEGLMVSYFNRSVTASDTLLQMARWFGYRDGYQDLCRLWINPEAADDYRFAHESVEELRGDLRRMFQLRLTPEEFGLAVRKHPNSLLITARNKMKSAQSVAKVISLAGRRLETTGIVADRETIIHNQRAFEEFVTSIEGAGIATGKTSSSWLLFSAVDKGLVAEFLENYLGSTSDPYFSGGTVSGWVRRSKAKQFQTWDVVVARGMAGGKTHVVAGQEIRLPKRNLVLSDGTLRVSGTSRRLAGRSDVSQLLPRDERARIEDAYRAEFPGKRDVPELPFYPALARPALMIYLLNPEDHDKTLPVPIVALKVAIPGDTTDVHNRDSEVEYVINTVAQQEWITEFTGADDDDIDD